MAPKPDSDSPKPPRIPQVGEVLRDLNGWKESETPSEPFCTDYSSDWLRPDETPVNPIGKDQDSY